MDSSGSDDAVTLAVIAVLLSSDSSDSDSDDSGSNDDFDSEEETSTEEEDGNEKIIEDYWDYYYMANPWTDCKCECELIGYWHKIRMDNYPHPDLRNCYDYTEDSVQLFKFCGYIQKLISIAKKREDLTDEFKCATHPKSLKLYQVEVLRSVLSCSTDEIPKSLVECGIEKLESDVKQIKAIARNMIDEALKECLPSLPCVVIRKISSYLLFDWIRFVQEFTEGDDLIALMESIHSIHDILYYVLIDMKKMDFVYYPKRLSFKKKKFHEVWKDTKDFLTKWE